jgi:peroxiredoxin Q/BCP
LSSNATGPAADDDYNAGAAALGPSLITAVNHPDTTLFWDYVVLGLVALVAVGTSSGTVMTRRLLSGPAGPRADLSLMLGHQSVSPIEEGEPVQRGDRAPDFELPDETGRPRRLSEMLRAGPVVLFFYPRAMTSGCTAEACHFRDLGTEFEKVGAQRMGISVDPVSKQQQFSAKHNFDYPLLSDEDGSVARAYGVSPGLLSFIRPVKRTTFVIGTDGLILDVINSETHMQIHADRALRTLSGA